LRTAAVLLALTLLSGTTVHAETIAQSGPKQVSLLEVYSSEGCSSCPPAEEWISRLKKDKQLWKTFVPVVFHVDYWDELGWKDKFSKKEYTDRQKAFASEWRNNSIYTPGFVLNGREWKRWLVWPGVPQSGDDVGSLSIDRLNAQTFKIQYKPLKPDGNRYFLSVALLGSGIISDIKAGENSGRRMVHDFTVLQFTRKPIARGNDGFESDVTLEIPTASGSYSIAVWITSSASGAPIQAAGSEL
jgi:hypothetical protein